MFRKTHEREESSEGDSLREISLSNRLGAETECVQYNISTLDYDDSSMPSNRSESEFSAYLNKDDQFLKNSPSNDIFLNIDSKVHDDKIPINSPKQFSNSENKTLDKEKLDIVKIYSMITNKNQGLYMDDNIKKAPLEGKNIQNKGEKIDTEKKITDEKSLDKDLQDLAKTKQIDESHSPKIQGKNFENKELYNKTPSIIIPECIDEEDKSQKNDEKFLQPTQDLKKKPECIYANFTLSKYSRKTSGLKSSQKDRTGNTSCTKCFII